MTIRLRPVWPPAAATIAAAALVFPDSTDAFEGPKRLVWGILALVLAAMSLVPREKSGTGRCRSVVLAGTVLLAWMALRSFAAAPFWRAAEPFAAWAAPPLLLLLAARIPWDGPSLRTVARAVVCAGIAEAVLMLLQRAGLDPLLGSATSGIAYGPGRMVGTVGYQNQAAEFIGLAVCCIPAAWKSRRVRIAAGTVLCATVVLTANRGAVLALVVAGMAAALVRTTSVPRAERRPFRRASEGAVLLVFCAVLALAATPELRNRIRELAAPSRSRAVQSRVWMARVAGAVFRDHPVAGAGAGAYAYEYVDRLGDLLPERKEHAQIHALVWARETHCDPLQFAAEFGLVGVALALVFLGALVRTLRKVPGAGPFAAAAFFLSVCSLFSFSWQTSLAAPAAGLLLGMAAGSRSGDGPDRTPSVSGPDRTGFAVSAAAACFLLFVSLPVALAGSDPEENYWDAFDDEASAFLRGRRLADAAAFALRYGQPAFAAGLCAKAATEWMSPELLLLSARAFEAAGHGDEAVGIWLRLKRSGLRHDEALRGLSRCLERRKRLKEAAAEEEERLRLWPGSFSDADYYRLCALKTMTGDAAGAEWLSRRFRDRAAKRGKTETEWTPEWANLRGGALLSLGRFDEARDCFEDALRRNPGLESARRNLESVRQR